MWKGETGDWQERRRHRVPDSPKVRPPPLPPVDRLGFLPQKFDDHAPTPLPPVATGPSIIAEDGAHEPAVALEETWVTLFGVEADKILDVREYLDLHVGRTVAHHMPMAPSQRHPYRRNVAQQERGYEVGVDGAWPSPHPVISETYYGGSSNEVYIQFASPVAAIRAVRTTSFRVEIMSGVACTAQRRLQHVHGYIGTADGRTSSDGVGWAKAHGEEVVDRYAGGEWTSDVPESLGIEFTVAWCTDRHFIRERAQRIVPQGPRDGTAAPNAAAEAAGSPSPVSSVESQSSGETAGLPDRRSGTIAGRPTLSVTREGTSHRPDAAGESPRGAHPLLPRPSRTPLSFIQPSQKFTPGSAGVHGSPHVRDGRSFAARVTDLASQSNSIGRERPRTVLSLFYSHPSASSPWFFIIARIVLWLGWTFVNLLSCLMPRAVPLKGRWSSPSAAREELAPVNAVTNLCKGETDILQGSLHRYGRRRRIADTLIHLGGESHLSLCELLHRCVPFAPGVADVNLVLWSWFVVKCPDPHRSLQQLKEQLAYLRPSDLSHTSSGGVRVPLSGVSFSSLGGPIGRAENQERMMPGEVAGEDGRVAEAPVLLAWRPVWWFGRYSILSLVGVLLSILYAVLHRY